jgi:hypothetical protein
MRFALCGTLLDSKISTSILPAIEIVVMEMLKNDSFLANWATLIRRNEKMTLLDVISMGKDDEHISFLNGVLDGARKHKSLATLKITGSVDDEPKVIAGTIGSRLLRVLEKTPALTQLHFEQLAFEQELATLFGQGLSIYKTVEVVCFKSCDIHALAIVEIVEVCL